MRWYSVRAAAALFFASLVAPAAASSEPPAVPEVHFIVLRLDYRSYEVKGGYEFTQPYRKTLPPEGFQREENLYVRVQPAGDFGGTEVQSRLTGQVVARATTVWNGGGHWQFPDGPLKPAEVGSPAPDPASFHSFTPFRSTEAQVAAAWESARRAGALSELAAGSDPYEVVILDHFYSVGLSNPATAEWIVIAFSHPQGPADVGLVTMDWPYSVITRDLATGARASVYNFSDTPQSFGVALCIEQGGIPVHESVVQAGTLEADGSAQLVFAPYTPGSPDSLLFRLRVVDGSGAPWTDAFADNNVFARLIGVAPEPTFAPAANGTEPGQVPGGGYVMDSDGDGDQDLLLYDYHQVLLQRDSTGAYVDIAGQVDVEWPPWPRSAMAADFTGDGHPDLLVTFFADRPLLLEGDGTGNFKDITETSGLGDAVAYFDADSLDLEGDGDLDIIFLSYEQELVYRNDGAGHFTDVTMSCGIIDDTQTQDVAIGDVDGDGFDDVFITNWGGPPGLFINNGSGHFASVAGPWTGNYGRKAIFLDCDGDGLQDILVLRDNGITSLYKNTGGLRFEDVSQAWGVIGRSFGGDVADLDKDGFPEVLITSQWGYRLLSSDGTRFIDKSYLIVNVNGAHGFSYDSPRFVDLNMDGLVDIYQMSASYYQVSPAPPYDPPPSDPWIGPPEGPRCDLCAVKFAPNPFVRRARSEALLSFRTSEPGRVEILVFSVGGRVVRRLFSDAVEDGDHVIPWDGRDDSGRTLPSGVYYCTIATRGIRANAKVILLR